MIISPYLTYQEVDEGKLVILDSLNSQIYSVDSQNKYKVMQYIENQQFDKVPKEMLVEGEKSELYEKLYNDFLHTSDYIHLVILPTESCNFRCAYCYEPHKLIHMSLDVQNAIIEYVRENIRNYKALRVEWFGGEPLCKQDTVDYLSEKLMRICKEENKPYYASMTTNGYLLDLDTFKKMFYKNHIVKYQITVDGLKDIHDQQRFLANGKGTFDVIVDNLRNIRDNISSRLFNIVIRCNITRDIYDDFERYVCFLENEFSGDLRFEVLWKIAWNPVTLCGDVKVDGEMYCEQRELHNCLKKAGNLRFGVNRGQLMKYGNICYASNKNSIVIGSDGTLYKCTVAFDKDINKVGHIQANGVLKLDEKKMRFWTERKACMDAEKCKECSIYPSCLGLYCSLNNVDSNGKFVCAGMKSYLSDYLSQISKHRDYVREWSNE